MNNPLKADYQRLRQLSCAELWTRERSQFDQASPADRMKSVSLVRAVGVVFSESGSLTQQDAARRWLRQLLHDPQEKIRRYAIAALPKLGAAEPEETEMLDLLDQAPSDREKKHVSQALQKIGGAATLERGDFSGRTLQKARANLARSHNPSQVRLAGNLSLPGLQIHLRCREGLEQILQDEAQTLPMLFRLHRTDPGLVVIETLAAFSLADVFRMRCFSQAALHLGNASRDDALAGIIASERTRRILEAFTEGPLRYRLEFPQRGHQRGLIRQITDQVFERRPALINDARDSPWQIDIREQDGQLSVELSPRLRPDPRFTYRGRDVPAASHPPLAAAMARLAGTLRDAIVWDPFCGSGLELIECALRGGVQRVIGTDLSGEAIAGARSNLRAALGEKVSSRFHCADFREVQTGPVTLIISNPPMGRRVPVPNLSGLISDLFATAENSLVPGGRLIFANPLDLQPKGQRLILEYRQQIDLGGFPAHLEKYVRR